MNKKTNNPFKKMNFTKQTNDENKNEVSFIEEATGETKVKKEAKKSKLIYMNESLVQRLDTYSQTKATRKESQNYIINQALEEWLEKRGV